LQVALSALVLLAGCNEFYGLDETKFGVPVDARPTCSNELRLASEPHPFQAGGYVLGYTTDEARTLAVGNQFGVVEGPPDTDDLKPAILEPAVTDFAESVRLTPEGDELFLELVNMGQYRVERYTRDGTRWRFAARLALPVTLNSQLTAPTRRLPGGRRMLIDDPAGLQEYVETAPDVWMSVGQPFEVTGFTNRQPNLTADGLHVIYVVNNNGTSSRLRYLSRPDVTQSFGAAQELRPFFGAMGLGWPFLTADCGRLYLLLPIEGMFFVSQS